MPTRDPTHLDAVSRNIQLLNIQLPKKFFVLYLVELHRVFCEFEFEEIIEMEVKNVEWLKPPEVTLWTPCNPTSSRLAGQFVGK
jgi:hypothetical protein